MSRTATNEYTGAKRRAYAASKPDKRRLILDDVCEMTGYSRKYANRLLTGSRKFKVRKGRGATYTEQDKAMLIRIWREVGCPCTTYFRANIVEWLQEFRTCVAHVPDNIATHLLSMSASTMDRLLKEVKREKLGSLVRTLFGESRIRQEGVGVGTAAAVRGLFQLPELLRSMQDARGEGQAQGRQRVHVSLRQAADAIRQSSRGTRRSEGRQGRPPAAQEEDQRHRALPPHPEKVASHQANLKPTGRVFPRPRQLGFGA